MSRARARSLWLLLFGGGIALRLLLYSGYGLGDDPNYFIAYSGIYRSGTYIPGDPYQMRFGIWVPVVLSLKLFGPTEAGFIGAITCASIANVALVYLLARQEWERPWALLAMALIAVFPLDVLSSTLFANDMMLATYCFAAFWLYRMALANDRGRAVRAFAAVASGVFLLFGFVSKPWVVLVGPLFLWEGVRRWRSAARYVLLAAAVTAGLVGGYLAWQWARFGDPLYHVTLSRRFAWFTPYRRDILLDYPRMLFLQNEHGSYFAGFYPHALVLLVVVLAARATRAGKWAVFFALMLLGLAAMPSHREQGHWVTLIPHIFRYLTLLSIPLCLALAAYLRELSSWRAPLGWMAAAVLLLTAVVDAVALTAPTREAFGDERRALAVLRQFPDAPVWTDGHLTSRFINLEQPRLDRVRELRAETPEALVRLFEAIDDGVVVTGGGRLPWYGCVPCIANLGPFQVPPTWSLVAEFDGPVTAYRREPLRIWRVSGARAR